MSTEQDNLQPIITQCPNCDAQFRVTESQLQVAAGRVRCGACLSVFDATEHLLLGGEQLPAALEDDLDGDVDAVLDELDELDGTATRPAQAEGLQETGYVSTPSEPQAIPPGTRGLDVGVEADTAEATPDLDALEAQLLSELRGEDVGSGIAADAPTEVATDAALAEAPAGIPGVPEAEDGKSDSIEAELGEVEAGIHNEVDATAAEPRAKEGPEDIPIIDALIADAELESPAKPERKSWATLALFAVGLIAIPAQVLWFQFDVWSKDESYRPLYGGLCKVVGCELPVMVDVTKLERREFHMRHHPESDNAYIFDLLIVNTASFDQPYPVIELVATTERGSLVAGRRFKPAEYLHGEVNPADLMPARTPVHVSLEIEHPGHPNLKFQTSFRSAP